MDPSSSYLWRQIVTGIMRRSCHFERFGLAKGSKNSAGDPEKVSVWSPGRSDPCKTDCTTPHAPRQSVRKELNLTIIAVKKADGQMVFESWRLEIREGQRHSCLGLLLSLLSSMKQSLKEPTVVLFVLIACGPLFLLEFAVFGAEWLPAESRVANANIPGGGVALGKLKSSRIFQSDIRNAAIAELRLAEDDEKDDGEGAEDGKDDAAGPDRLWDSVMLG
jgi:hypothetical protein